MSTRSAGGESTPAVFTALPAYAEARRGLDREGPGLRPTRLPRSASYRA